MIPGVGRYSTLFTPRAGSLFHAVFHVGRGADLAADLRADDGSLRWYCRLA